MIAESAEGDGARAEIRVRVRTAAGGDNFQVECSLKENFSEILGQTCVMTMWRRLYVQPYYMTTRGVRFAARSGETLHVPDADSDDDVLFPVEDPTTQFSVGDEIEIFSTTASYFTTITAMQKYPTLTLSVPDSDVAFSGKLLGAAPRGAALQAIPADLLAGAFGSAPDGADGGAFVEFSFFAPRRTPRVQRFTTGSLAFDAFRSDAWQGNNDTKGSRTNVLVILSATYPAPEHLDESFLAGTTNQDGSFVFMKAFPPARNADTLVHELGHQLKVVTDPSIDQRVDHPNHEGSDNCVMSYRTNDKAPPCEFCVECHTDMRNNLDPMK